MKPVFIFISAGDCGACKHFKNRWPDIQKSLKNLVTIKEIVVPSMHGEFPRDYPKDITEIEHWFPMLVMMHPKDLEDGIKNPNLKTRFVVYNGDTSGGYVRHTKAQRLTEDLIVGWVKDTAKKVIDGPPTYSQTGRQSTPPQKPKSVLPKEEKKSDTISKKYSVHDSIFVPTCERNANITPSIQNGGYSPF